MTKVAVAQKGDSIKQDICLGTISKNVQLNGYPGHPNPTLAALCSAGIIDLSKMSNSLSFNGFGGD